VKERCIGRFPSEFLQRSWSNQSRSSLSFGLTFSATQYVFSTLQIVQYIPVWCVWWAPGTMWCLSHSY
jgi:hypothetical protein